MLMFHLVCVSGDPRTVAANKSFEEALRDVIRLALFADSELSTSSGPAGLSLGYYITVLTTGAGAHKL